MKEQVRYEKENPVEENESGSLFLDRPRQVESMDSSGAIVPAVGKSIGRSCLQLSAGSSRLRSMIASGETGIAQRQEEERQPNKTGLPDRLKEGIEQMSGYDLSDVRVNYNSPKPAQVNALAYTQGTAIEVAPRQEKHLPHEAWHVVQQMQGRVKEQFKVNGVGVNGDRGLEREADVMGNRSWQGSQPRTGEGANGQSFPSEEERKLQTPQTPRQRMIASPPTSSATYTTRKRTDPVNKKQYEYADKMESVLNRAAMGALQGSKPNNKAEWWPDIQYRHQIQNQNFKIFWVQAHLLNDNLGGPGEPKNLIPLSNTANTNMETKGERKAKELFNAGKILSYTVWALWDSTPEEMLDAYGQYDSATKEGLLPVEMTAPSGVAWQIEQIDCDMTTGQWNKKTIIQTEETSWANQFPQ